MISLGIQAAARAAARTSAVPDGGQAQNHREADLLPELRQQLQEVMGGHFEVLDAVAIGGMATIFQLRHHFHGGLFAAKVLHPELATRPEVVAGFRLEAVRAARLGDHPNAIPVMDAGESGGLWFLIMPFVEGEDLDHLLQHRGPFSRAEALHLAAQICSLLCHAESHGITHCDVAPGNIRLDTFGRYRLMDFGVSRSAEDVPGPSLGGTPLYTSPEQLRGDVPDVRADLYALGLVLCEVLTGRPALHATTLEGLRTMHLTGEWHLPEELAEDLPLSALLRRLTATDREQRFSSAFEVSGALAALGFERPEFMHRSPNATGATAPPRRSRLS